MGYILQFDPLSEEALSTPIAGLSEAVTKISQILDLNSSNYLNVPMNEVFISSTDRYRIYQVENGKRLWLGNPAVVIRKNGNIIDPVSAGFEIDYIGGAIKFETNYRLISTDVVTADFYSLNADSKTINDIKTSLSDIQVIVSKNKGYYDNPLSLRTAHPTGNTGDYAIVGGATDTFWVWDVESNDWKDTFKSTDLSEYFTKTEINNLLGLKENVINAHGADIGSDNYYYSGRKSWIDLLYKIRNTVLAGLDKTNKSEINDTDNILGALGKLQGQINDFLSKIGNLTTLNTNNKNSIVEAINEINTKVSSEQYSTLATATAPIISLPSTAVKGKMEGSIKGNTLYQAIIGGENQPTGTTKNFIALNAVKYFLLPSKTIITGTGISVNVTNSTGVNANIMAVQLTTPYENWTADQLNSLINGYWEGLGNSKPSKTKSVGKNLFNGELESGTIVSNGTIANDTTRIRSKHFVKVKPSTLYKISNGIEYVFAYDKNKNFLTNFTLNATSFTTDANTSYVKFRAISTNIEQKIMLNEGSTISPYEPYTETELFCPVELRSVPNGIADEFTFDGKFIQRTKEHTLQSGDITTVYTGWTNVDSVSIKKPLDYIAYGNVGALLGSMLMGSYRQFSGSADSLENINKFRLDGNNVLIELVVPKGTYANLAAAQTALAGTKIRYQLATPIETQYPASNLIAEPSGTIYVDSAYADAMYYASGIQVIGRKFKSINKVTLVNKELGTEKDITSQCTLNTNKDGFTATGIQPTDLLWFSLELDEGGTLPSTSYSYPLNLAGAVSSNIESIKQLDKHVNEIEILSEGNRLSIEENSSAIGQLSNPPLNQNPDFQIWQRGTSFTNFLDNILTYTADRWNCAKAPGTSILVSKDIDGSFKFTQIGVGSSNVSQYIEGDYSNLIGKKVTMSVCSKGNVDTIIGILDNITGFGSKLVPASAEYKITSLTVQLPNSITKDKLRCLLNFANNQGTINIKWIKLELGEIATPFSPRPNGEELALCQRYYQKYDTYMQINMMVNESTRYDFAHYFNQMRVTPTVTFTKTTALFDRITNVSQGNITSDKLLPIVVRDKYLLFGVDKSLFTSPPSDVYLYLPDGGIVLDSEIY